MFADEDVAAAWAGKPKLVLDRDVLSREQTKLNERNRPTALTTWAVVHEWIPIIPVTFSKRWTGERIEGRTHFPLLNEAPHNFILFCSFIRIVLAQNLVDVLLRAPAAADHFPKRRKNPDIILPDDDCAFRTFRETLRSHATFRRIDVLRAWLPAKSTRRHQR